MPSEGLESFSERQERTGTFRQRVPVLSDGLGPSVKECPCYLTDEGRLYFSFSSARHDPSSSALPFPPVSIFPTRPMHVYHSEQIKQSVQTESQRKKSFRKMNPRRNAADAVAAIQPRGGTCAAARCGPPDAAQGQCSQGRSSTPARPPGR